jgi:DNA-binding response OmpR family regulator
MSKKILVVDDDEAIRMLYAEELEEEGYDVIMWGEACRLMELIAEESPDLVVMDIKLGQSSGLDLLQDIRNTYYQLPVILCTGYPLFSTDMKSIAADCYVLKSSDLFELKTRIASALQPGDSAFRSPIPGSRPDAERISMYQTRLNR